MAPLSETTRASNLHAKMLKAFERILDGEEPTAAQLAVISKYLKDNDITLPSDDDANKALARKFVEKLPFTSTDEHGLPN